MSRKTIAYPIIEREKETVTKNILEYIFRDSGTEILLYTISTTEEAKDGRRLTRRSEKSQ